MDRNSQSSCGANGAAKFSAQTYASDVIIKSSSEVQANPYTNDASEPIPKRSRLSTINSDVQITVSSLPSVASAAPEKFIPTIPGILISEYVCIEVCAGSANLSRALKEVGFATIPIDWANNRHSCKVRCLQLDLTRPEAKQLFLQFVLAGNIAYIHFAPPCGTGSRARERPISSADKQRGAPEPQPLRSNEHPLGFPWLQGADKARVEAANEIYRFCAYGMKICLARNILCSAENPTNAYIWQIDEWKELILNSNLEINDHQVCMLGGERNKWSRWLATKGLFSCLQVECDNSHTHKPWGFVAPTAGTKWNFATAQEAEYPALLCRLVAQDIYSAMVKNGAVPVPQSLTDHGFSDKQRRHINRASTGKLPRGRTIPQLIPEFAYTSEANSFIPADDAKLLRQYYKRDEDGSQQAKLTYIVGHLRSPKDFLECSKNCQHPVDILLNIDDITKRAIFNVVTLGPEGITIKRNNFLDQMRTRAQDLASEESKLHSAMHPHVERVMKGKNLLLLREIMESSGCKDTNLFDELVGGFNLTGTAQISNELTKRLVPATLLDDELKETGSMQRIIDLHKPTKYAERDAVMALTQEEVENGWLEGPFTAAQMDTRFGKWISHKRFGLRQGEKVRLIDDCKQSGVNLALCTTEKLDLMDIDRLAELLKVILKSQTANGRILLDLSTGEKLEGKVHQHWEHGENAGLQFVGRLMDLKSAYKQLAVSESSLWSSNVHIPKYSDDKSVDPSQGRDLEYYSSSALIFGATAAVYAFNRFARALWRCMSVSLDMILTQFYDDFPHLEPQQTSRYARQAATDFLDILGVTWSGGAKDKDFDFIFEPLGVRVDLSDFAGKAAFTISNKPSRVSAICGQVDEILTDNAMGSSLASELHGKLNFAQNQIFGRAGLPAIREISNRANDPSRAHELTERLVKALLFLKDHLQNAPPRVITACDPSKNLIVFSDGAFEKEVATWGFFIFDTADDTCITEGGTISAELTRAWMNSVGDQIITQVELFAVLIARVQLEKATRGRKVVYFIDNDAARDSLIKGYSDSKASMNVIYQFFALERTSPSSLWFARVPSHSNVSDAPSRGLVRETSAEYNARIVTTHIPTSMLNDLMQL